MNATETAPPDGKYPASLAEALAVFQAGAPKIGKGSLGKIEGESKATGKKFSYEYKYADLADVSREILPRLGEVGLSFTSRPTIADGQFVLSYSLMHVSGEREDGVYPLPGNGTPQAIGSAITYARRYCLCAVTGAAPDSDDDDARAATDNHRQSAGDVFENSRPAPPQRRAERMASVPGDDPWYGDTPPDANATDASEAKQPPAKADRPRVTRPEAAETDQVWLDLMGQEIGQIKTRADGAKAWAGIATAFKENTCSAADRKALEALVAGKVSEVVSQEHPEGSEAA